MKRVWGILPIGLVGSLLALFACHAPAGAGARPGAMDSLVVVQFRTNVTEAERAELDSLLRRISAGSSGPSQFVEGEVDRLPSSTSMDRFVLTSSRSEGASEDRIVLYALGGAIPGGVSDPYDTGISDQPGRFRPMPILDYDGDGSADYAYCIWPTDSGSATFHAVGYRVSGWYPIRELKVPMPDCGPGDAP